MWSLSPPPGPSILLVLSDSLELACNGLTDKLHRGSVVFLPSEREAKFYPKVEEKETLLFQAYCSLWWQYVQQTGLSRYFLFNSFLFCIFENYWSFFDWFNCMFVLFTHSVYILDILPIQGVYVAVPVEIIHFSVVYFNRITVFEAL